MHVLLRADAGEAIGTGHLMRMRTMAEEYRRRGARLSLLTACVEPQLLDPFRELGVIVHGLDAACPDPADARRMAELIQASRPDWVVVDGYDFDSGYLRDTRSAGTRVIVFDDMAHLAEYPVDVVVNQNAHAGLLRYRTSPDTKVLCGPRYAVLRAEFRDSAPDPRTPPTVGHILVTLGGADPHRATEVVVKALGLVMSGRPSVTGTVVVGGSNPRHEQIAGLVAEVGLNVQVVHAASEMREHIAAADIAISTAGTTVWELAYLGVPSLLIEAGEAEKLMLAGLASIDLFEAIGRAEALDSRAVASALEERMDDTEWRTAMSQRGMQTVDGRGIDRIIDLTMGATH